MIQKAILHIDGDAFFASCEVTRNPALRGKPVVTGHEKGIASSMSYEAKALGVKRAMRVVDIKKLFPQVLILHSDYALYAMYAERMYAIVRRYTPVVEEYSIDECFADLTGIDVVLGMSYEEIARRIQSELYNELNMTFSVGLSVNKSMAKLASKWNKPNGCTIIPNDAIGQYLIDTPVHKLWGVGGQTSYKLRLLGIRTAHDLASRDPRWVTNNLDKHMAEMHAELNGHYVHRVDSDVHSVPISVQRTRMFSPPSRDRSFILAQLSHHVEHACFRLRQKSLFAKRFSFFLKTQQFTYHTIEIKLVEPSSSPSVFIGEISKNLNKIFVPKVLYRASGVRLSELTPVKGSSLGLFDSDSRTEAMEDIDAAVDSIAMKYGSETVVLASSMKATKGRGSTKKGAVKKSFRIPILGEVK